MSHKVNFRNVLINSFYMTIILHYTKTYNVTNVSAFIKQHLSLNKRNIVYLARLNTVNHKTQMTSNFYHTLDHLRKF